MHNLFTSKTPSMDAAAIAATIENALASAGISTAAGPMRQVTDTIRRALGTTSAAFSPTDGDASIIDVIAREVGRESTSPSPSNRAPVIEPVAPGTFVCRTFSNSAGTRAYKLYVPTSPAAAPIPLVVMLHGCTQSPDDFAAGTRMNVLAEQHGFIVVYPEQSTGANASKCWNWFNTKDQVRDTGEPSLIAGITREVVANHPVDPRRIFVAGLSAGAAMAVILGEAYPDLFAGIGVHSGLPYASAHDTPSAFAAMGGQKQGVRRPDVQQSKHGATATFVPTIVFHGDQDRTVGRSNGVEVVRQAAAAWNASTCDEISTPITCRGTAPGGRVYSKTTYLDRERRPAIESWVIHGAGHAWAGGDPNGSYTDRSGPDASAEMVRFFLTHTDAAACPA